MAKRTPAGGNEGRGGGGMAIPMPKPRGGGGGGGFSDDVRNQSRGAAPPRVNSSRPGQAAAHEDTESSPALNAPWVFWENRELPRGSARERAGDSYHHTLG